MDRTAPDSESYDGRPDVPVHRAGTGDPQRLGLVAFGLSVIWIVASDLVLNRLVGTSDWVGWSILKGLAYSVVLGVTIGTIARRWEDRRLRLAADAATEASTQARATMRSVVDQLSEALFVIGDDRRISFANPAAADLFRCPLADLPGRRLPDVGRLLAADGSLLPDEEVPGLQALRHGASTVALEAGLQLPDGTRRDVIVDAAPLPAPMADAEAAAVVVVRDVTDFRAAQRRERAAKAQLEHLVSRVPDVFALIDVEGRIQYASPAVTELVGVGDEELIGRQFDNFIHQDDLEGIRALFIAAVGGDLDEKPHGMRIIRPDNTVRHVEFTLASLLDVPDVEAFAVVVRDVTERILMERERLAYAERLEQTNEELQRAAKARDELLAVASHELRTPLTPIKGFTALLRERSADHLTPADLTMLDTIERNTEKLIHRVDQLLLSTGLRTGATRSQKKPVVLVDAVRAAVETAESGSSVSVDVDPSIIVDVDPDHLGQIVRNLVSNAMVYGRPPVEVRASQTAATIRLRVTDHGDGVPDEFVPRLWDRLAQATTGDRRTATGLGMGLYLVRRLARINDLTVDYEPNPAGGACFTVTFGMPMDDPEDPS